MSARLDHQSASVEIRDFQVSKVYKSGNMASKAILGSFWRATLTEEESVAFADMVTTHPAVLAKWEELDIGLSFNTDKRIRYAQAQVEDSHIFLPKIACNEFLILHELAHFYKPTVTEATHGAGYCAILHYLVHNILGKKAGDILLDTYEFHKVKYNKELIPVDKPKTIVEIVPAPVLEKSSRLGIFKFMNKFISEIAIVSDGTFSQVN